ncbi:hypothetical protein LCGC14_0777530 [marine sediment metagenome]|uniref:Uncharacterized protein n=1 Tax=marine sediment metagenome TaxID=412755 RepID=A0A0F9T3J5_9ZZZZ
MATLTPKMKKMFGEAHSIAVHMDRKASWSWLARLGHWVIVSWWCECCKEQRRRRLRKIRS